MKGVKGNGMTLGLKAGSSNVTAGLQVGAGGTVTASTSSYGVAAGSAITSNSATPYTYGITTDTTKSGIETEVNSNINYVIKY